MSTCPICKGSGETGSYGVLDCSATNCTAAVERLALEEAASTASLTDYDARWMAYGLGKAAALEQAANDLMRIAVGLIRECTAGLEDADDEEETYLNGRASGIGHLHTELLKLFPK